MTTNGILRSTDYSDSSQQTAVNGDSHSLRSLCSELHQKIESFLQEDVEKEKLRAVQAQCRHSLAIVQEAIDRYPYIFSALSIFLMTYFIGRRLHTLSLSYNGGKDCLVLLILYLSLLSTHRDLPSALPAVYIASAHPFSEVDDFVASSSAHYNLALTRQNATKNSMKAAFASYLNSDVGQDIKAVFVGTRRTDPHGEHLTAFDMTDRGWPSFMRIHPVLEWKYVEVWAFLRYLGLSWCPLYDEGFTSLGGMQDTHPNPKLRYIEDGGKEGFHPAWVLEEDDDERLGRNS